MRLNTSDICRFIKLSFQLQHKGFMSARLGKLQMDLFHCVYKIELVEFREKVDVAVEIAKSMQELIIFYT